MPASDQMAGQGPGAVIKTIPKSWTCPLDAEPSQALIELQPGTAEQDTGLYAGLTPGQARAVAAALIELADAAESAGPHVREARQQTDGSPPVPSVRDMARHYRCCFAT